MNELLGSNEICVADYPLIMASSRIKPRHLNVKDGFGGPPCWVNELIFEPLESETERPRFFGKQYIRLLFYYRIVPFIYESGAILGYARKKKVSLLERLLKIPYKGQYKNEGDIVNAAQDAASIRLNEFKIENSRKPLSFDEFLSGTADSTKNIKDSSEFLKEIGRKIPVNKVIVYLRVLVIEGVGFGSKFPELTARMFKSYYDIIDMDKWQDIKAENADIPDSPKILSLESVQDAILMKVAITAYDSPPELLQELDLLSYLESFKNAFGSDNIQLEGRDILRLCDEFHDRYSTPYDVWFDMYKRLLGSKL
jgi:hypothetical protein